MKDLTLKGEKIVHSKDKYGPIERRMDFDIAQQYLEDVKKIFDRNGIEFCLMYGTLVGAVRDENFVEYDDDVDVALWVKDADKVNSVRQEFKDLGYYFCATRIAGTFNFFYIARKEVAKTKVDIYMLFEHDNKLWFPRYTNVKGRGPTVVAIPYTKKYFENMQEINFLGSKYKVPSPPEEFLEELWGNWWVAKGGQFGIIPAQFFTVDEFERNFK